MPIKRYFPMRHTFLLAFSAMLLLASCNKQAPEQTVETPEAAMPTGPYTSLCRTFADTVTLDGHRYVLSLDCEPDSSTVVRDAVDTEFYDNRVTITVMEGDTQILSHTFLRKDFPGQYDPAHCILQGVAFMGVSQGKFLLGAQVGEPGNDEGGANYAITLTPAGDVSIEVDTSRE